ncbi:hypothetical protein, partial [Shewanella sp. CG12_big_fil_rev_8_21_14_0_65_47_15]|uniref:hypothetical protein n=1 Tax=Shewanella sp. CG12_big_fil_rev_8_21_14_0_65_47_15 TaxID=1975537 RepID=UPI0025F3FFEF
DYFCLSVMKIIPRKFSSLLSQTILYIFLTLKYYADAKQVSHGGLRDDRPPHGRGGRASKDGLAARR